MAEVELPQPEFKLIPVKDLIPFEHNPQEQSGATFAALVESMKEMGMAETVMVSGPFENKKYKIVSGHHKVDSAKVLGAPEIPCMVVPPMSDDDLAMYIVKMNMIRGQLNPHRFTKLFNELRRRYSPEELRKKMGISSEAVWNKIYRDVRKSLPPDVIKDLDKTKKEVTDIDGLARTIQGIFTKHGDQLQQQFLVFEYGGKTHLLLKMSSRTAANVERLVAEADEKKLDLNLYVNALLEKDLTDKAIVDLLEK